MIGLVRRLRVLWSPPRSSHERARVTAAAAPRDHKGPLECRHASSSDDVAWSVEASAASATFSPLTHPAAEVNGPAEEGEQHQDDRRRQGEAKPGEQPARHPSAPGPDQNAELAARWPRQHLTERDEIGVRRL